MLVRDLRPQRPSPRALPVRPLLANAVWTVIAAFAHNLSGDQPDRLAQHHHSDRPHPAPATVDDRQRAPAAGSWLAPSRVATVRLERVLGFLVANVQKVSGTDRSEGGRDGPGQTRRSDKAGA